MTDELKNAAQRMLNEAVRANETALEHIGVGLIDLSAIAALEDAITTSQPAAQATPEPEFDDCSSSPTGKHSESWFGNGDCDHCKTGAQNAPMIATPTQQAAGEPATIEDNSQQWQGMDGATAWHLIDRHADGWGDIAKMMGEWLKANTHPAPGVPEGFALVPVEPTDEMVMAGALAHQRSPCHDFIGPIGDAWVAMLAAAQAKGGER